MIHLGDIADVFADNDQAAARLQSITLSTSPIPGNSTRLKIDEIRSRLLNFNVEVGALEFQGSSIVLVTRRSQLPTSEKIAYRTTLASTADQTPKPRPFRKTELTETTELASHGSATPGTVSNLRNISTADIRLADAVIHDLVRDYLAEWATDWGTPIIRPLLAIPTVPKILSARAGNLKIVSGRPLSEDVFFLTVAIPTGEASVAHSTTIADTPSPPNIETVQIRVRVTRRPKVLAARRTIPQGQVVRETDLEWREVDDLRNGAFEPETIVGMETRRTIRQGDFIKLSSVRPPTLIKRNELVDVTVTHGTVQATLTLKAQRDGTLNDIIELVPLDGKTKDTLLVRVTGKGRAEPLDRQSDDKDPQIQLTVGKG